MHRAISGPHVADVFLNLPKWVFSGTVLLSHRLTVSSFLSGFSICRLDPFI